MSSGLVCQRQDFRFSSGWYEKTLEGLKLSSDMSHLTFWDEYYGCCVEGGQEAVRMKSERPIRRPQQQQKQDDSNMDEEVIIHVNIVGARKD